jgi:hypothetical protein
MARTESPAAPGCARESRMLPHFRPIRLATSGFPGCRVAGRTLLPEKADARIPEPDQPPSKHGMHRFQPQTSGHRPGGSESVFLSDFDKSINLHNPPTTPRAESARIGFLESELLCLFCDR